MTSLTATSYEIDQPSAQSLLVGEETPLEEEKPSLFEEAPKEVESQSAPQKSSRWLGTVMGLLILIAGVMWGWRWWQYQLTHVSTDNAQIQGHISPVSARVSGTVEKVLVEDGDYVKAGQLLVILEAKDLKLSVQEAQANLAAAQARLKGATETVELTQDTHTPQVQEAQANLLAKQAAIRAAQTNLIQAQASVQEDLGKVHQSEATVEMARANRVKAQTQATKTQTDFRRYAYLSEQGAVAMQQRDTAQAAFQDAIAELKAAQEEVRQAQAEVNSNQALLRQAQAQVSTAQAQLQQAQAEAQASTRKVAETQMAGQQVQIQQAQANIERSQVDQAKAALALAQQQLNYTVIRSPVAGYVGLGMGQLTVQVGQTVAPQQPLLSVVPLQSQQLYVEANFKETALKRLHLGQPAEIEADAYPGEVFEAVVAGISPATGAQFALIPPDNATGNFNKVVQWVPVRLTLKPGTDPQQKLRSGLSVRVTVEITASGSH
jgi:membrane fusion protein (multidrug efflux system)